MVSPQAAEAGWPPGTRLPAGGDAAIIGEIEQDARVVMETARRRRMLDELEDDPLPRIC